MEIVGIGNALMDVIAFVDDDTAPALGFHNNVVAHIDRQRLAGLVASLPGAVMSAGGGAANTVRAAALLGGRACFVGCVGVDELGEQYASDLRGSGVECLLSRSGSPTGVYCALVRPDGGRTLLVSPAAALDLSLGPAPDGAFRRGALLYLDGFLASEHGFLMECITRGKSAGMSIALDLGSQGLVRAQRDFLLELIPQSLDYIFANEDEFAALVDLPMREGLELLSDLDIEFVIKRADRGAVWARSGSIVDSPVRELWPVDETGAGDAFAAGFLSARTRGLPPERCLRLGNRVAEEVLAVPGLDLDPGRLSRAADSVLV